MRGKKVNGPVVPISVIPISQKTKTRTGGSRRTLANSLYFVPLALSVCGVFGPVITAVEDGWSLRLWLPIVVWVIWAVAAGYSVLLRRSFFNDIAPYFVLPFGVLFRSWQLVSGVRTAASWGFKAARMDISDSGALITDNFIPVEFSTIRKHVGIMRVMRRYEHAIVGYNPQRVVLVDWKDAKHLLIQGETGVGKTTVALTLIMSMLNMGPSVFSKWEFYLHDAKRVIGPWFSSIHKMYPEKFHIQLEFDNALAEIKGLYEEMRRRLALIGDELGMEPEDVGLSRILFVADEPQVWYDRKVYGKQADEYEAHIKHLVNLGRQAGIHVVLVTPYALGNVITTDYRGNLRIISGFMKKNTIQSHGIQGVVFLKKQEFLYTEDTTQPEVMFHTYLVTANNLEVIKEEMSVGSYNSAEEIMLHLFATMPDCGYRTIQKEGLLKMQALVSSGQQKEVLFPWSAIKIDIEEGKEVVRPSKSADLWIRETMDHFIAAGVAEDMGPRRARKFIGGTYANALSVWRKYVAQNPITRQ